MKRQWQILFQQLDADTQIGACIGLYDADHGYYTKRIRGHAVRDDMDPDEGPTAETVAGLLRSLADWLDQNKEKL